LLDEENVKNNISVSLKAGG